ncbi:MAG: hypothetical protein L6282_08345 [Candidatus Methanoperedenaceae archaeon]|nr:hypothetical protein [Candidatus Methanoperedenaceae archaeon]
MLTVEEYTSGEIFEFMKQIDIAVELLRVPLIKNVIRKKMTGKLEKYRDDFVLASLEDEE